MKNILLVLLSILISASLWAQPTQNISGRVVDMETQATLPGVRVSIVGDTTGLFKSGTDIDGRFKIQDVPVGRHSLVFTYIGYRAFQSEITLTSGKEFVINVELEESFEEMKEVIVTSQDERGEASNEMAMVSARRFSVEETERYAGSRGDPARMASNFAGVSGSDDSRNDIVVRGNSPIGVLWQVEGVAIPNPNHFAIAGSSGGPTTILNNKVLSNGDFYTSAFPAEFGNSVSAVFDIGIRNGNINEYEFSGQFGVLGMELTAEGPLNKEKNSSFLANYRYSTLGIFQSIGIDVGTDAIPTYTDGAFKLSLPAKNGGHWGVFGVGGLSNVHIKISDQKTPQTDLYGDNDRDQLFGSQMGFTGFKYSKSLNKKSFFSTTLTTSYERQDALHEYVIRHIDSSSNEYVLDSLYDILDYTFQQNKVNLAMSMTTKLNKQHVLKYGIQAEANMYNFVDSTLDTSHTNWVKRWDAKGTTFLIQPYIQWKYKVSEDLVVTSGWHALYFEQSNSFSFIEPRVGMKYKLGKMSSLNAGAGIHSQIQPFYTYHYHINDDNGDKVYHNENMDVTKSFHAVLGVNRSFKSNMRVKSEVFYQSLWNVPVEVDPSAFSLLNQGSGFTRFFPDSLQNTGTGENYGFELTVEKFFDNDFFFLATGSIYNSTYKGSDNVKRNTDFNGVYAFNLLGGKEYKINKKNVLSFGGKLTIAGGKRYGEVDTLASQALNELIFLDDNYNENQFEDYFRLDVKINYTINAKKVSHEIGLDLLNITGQENILGLTYTPGNPNEQFSKNYQLGFLPIFFYRIDF